MTTRGFGDIAATTFRLINARVPACLTDARDLTHPDGLASCDILVDNGRIAAIAHAGASAPHADIPALNLDHGIVLPRLLDVHTHIDKGHIWPRRPNPDGTIASARGAVMADREANWSAADVRARMDFALRCALAHGTGAIRTHIDSFGKQTAISWPVLAEVRAAWKDRIAIQAVSNYPLTIALDDEPSSATWSKPPRAMAASLAATPSRANRSGNWTRRSTAPSRPPRSTASISISMSTKAH